MKGKYILYIMVVLFLLLPIYVNAEVVFNNTDQVSVTKYYKTTYYRRNDSITTLSLDNSITQEITEEEFNSSNLSSVNAMVETEYKKMTTTISKNGNYYQYKVNLLWKNMPSTRSYDTIGIGFPASVKMKTQVPYFKEEYCTTNDDCKVTTGYLYSYTGRNGVGVTFQVPTGNIKSMNQTLYFDVEKNVDATINTQYAYGDYSHAQKSISLVNAKKYKVGSTGIDFESEAIKYYDDIPVAQAKWTGTW